MNKNLLLYTAVYFEQIDRLWEAKRINPESMHMDFLTGKPVAKKREVCSIFTEVGEIKPFQSAVNSDLGNTNKEIKA